MIFSVLKHILFSRNFLRMSVAFLFFGAASPSFACDMAIDPNLCRQQQQQVFNTNMEMARQAQQQQATPPQPTMYWVNNFWGLATHADAKDVWVVTGYVNENDARSAAITACQSEMGDGCQIYSGWNNSITIVRAVEGEIYWVADSNAGRSKSATAAWCKNDRGCETLLNVTATPWLQPIGSNAHERLRTYFPTRGSAVDHIAAVAFSDTGDTWVTTGSKSSKQAGELVNAKCKNKDGSECKWVTVLDAWILQYSRSDGTEDWRAGPTEAATRKAISDICRKKKLTCEVSKAFDAGTKRLEKVPNAPGTEPLFASTAWIKGSAEPWNNILWLSAGNATEEQSQRQALALCETATKIPCESTFTAANNYVIIYRDSQGNTRTSARPTEKEARDHAKTVCKEANIKCTVAGMFWTRQAGNFTIDATANEKK